MCIRDSLGSDALYVCGWSHDGSEIFFTSDAGVPFVKETLAFAIGREGGEPRRITGSTGPMQLPAFSHDGSEIAFIGHERGGDVGGRYNHELLIVPVAGGAVRSLSAGVDRPVTDYVICDIKGVGGQQAPIWSGGDRELFVPLCSEGACAIAAFARDGSGHRLAASGERDIYAFSRADDGTLAFGYSTPTVPSLSLIHI